MRLEDLLARGRVLIPLGTASLADGVAALAPPSESGGRSGGSARFEGLLRGEFGSVRRISPVTLVVRLGVGGGEAGWAALGVAERGLALEEGEGGDGAARILLIVAPPESGEGEGGSVEQIARVLRDPAIEARLLASGSSEEVRGIRRLMDAELIETLRVEHVLLPLNYRVFPDTPLSEVVDLMARRGLPALPVVGEGMQVLGMVTAGDALRYALRRRGKGPKGGGERPVATAREVMRRSVMCVSEDQELVDAAQLMINKDAAHLPVVREGEIVGILTRDAVLGALFGEG